MAGVQLRFSTAFHPQTDGQSEVVNKVIAMYLRCVTGDRPHAWVDWLAWAEYCYNTSYHSALRATPFEVVYGRPPPPILLVDPATVRTEAAGELLRARDDMLAEVRQRLVQAQQVAKHYYDGRHREVEYAVGDWVWSRLLHRSHQSLDPRAKRKLGPRYAGPFVILERIGTLAYRLQLPDGARIHDVFHVGLLKPYRGVPPDTIPPLPPTAEGRLLPSPAKVLRAQLRRDVWHLLVQWEGLPAEEATWEPRDAFQQHYPDYQLEDELWFVEIPSNIIVTTNTGCYWRMTTVRKGGDAYIDQGWAAFAVAHQLQIGQFLIFKKVSTFQYNVVIFDHTCTEVMTMCRYHGDATRCVVFQSHV
nr:uncharacterized protein LOC127303218 [Lolium perenne]